jgi:hypothetical protein
MRNSFIFNFGTVIIDLLLVPGILVWLKCVFFLVWTHFLLCNRATYITAVSCTQVELHYSIFRASYKTLYKKLLNYIHLKRSSREFVV